MPVEFFLRRTNSGASRDEYLFLPTADIEVSGQEDQTAPSLPGDTGADDELIGTNSNNFIILLGSYQLQLRFTGTIFDLASSQYPDISGASGNSDIYVTSGSTSPADQTAQTIRWELLKYYGNQANSTYSDFRLGYRDFSQESSPTAGTTVTFDGTTYTLFEGAISQPPRLQEAAAQPGQFFYSIQFKVGQTQ